MLIELTIRMQTSAFMTPLRTKLHRMPVALSCALLCAALPAVAAVATQTKSGGSWLDPSNWTLGFPGAADVAAIEGHVLYLENFGGAATLQVNGGLDVRGAEAPSTTFGSLTIERVLIVGLDATGNLDLSKGGRLRSHDTHLAYRTGSQGNLTINGAPSWRGDRSSWINTGNLSVGSAGFGVSQGSVSAFNGATVETYNTAIASGMSTGVVEIDNASWTNTNLFSVGSGGTRGSLSITRRGSLKSLTGVIGYGAGTTTASTDTLGTASIDNSTWSNSGDFHVGSYARGVLVLRNQGLIENNSGTIGYATSAVGEVVINNATWANRAGLVVGHSGQGTLRVENGATVISANGLVGYHGSAKGTVTVDNGRWANAGELKVGHGAPFTGSPAEGRLRIQNGGIVSTGSAVVALTDSSWGHVTVGGVNSSGREAQWIIDGQLQVGDSGQAALEVGSGGIVRSRETYVGYRGTGTVLLAGDSTSRGTLETRQLFSGTGAGPRGGSLTFAGGVLRATADQMGFVRNFGVVSVQAEGAHIDSNGFRVSTDDGFVGPGGINKLGQGVLDLRGVSFLAALSTVQAGTLLVNGGVTGDVQVNGGATLGGSGRVQGVVSVLPGGTLSPGNSPGTLTVGSLVLQPGSILTIELGAPGDQIAAMGDVRLNGRINFTGDPSAFGSGSFLSYGGTLVDAGIVIGSLPDGLDPRAFVFDFSTPGLVGVMQAVPETGTGLLMSLGGLALLLTSRKRRTQAVAP